MKLMCLISRLLENGKKIWLCFFSSVHSLRYPGEDDEVDCNPFTAPKPKDNSECVFSKNTCANEGQGLLTAHSHPVHDMDLTRQTCF